MRYRHEWIIMEVTGRDQHDCPTGHVLFHSPDPEEASAAFARISKEKPRHLFEFYGVKWVFSGKQLEQKGELAEGINRALKEMRDAG